MFRSLIRMIPGASAIVKLVRTRQEKEISQIVRDIFGQNHVRFVQVGSNDGIHNDPIFPISSTNEMWSGILIEPVPYLFERLKQNYGHAARFIFENVAIGKSAGTMAFYYVSERAQLERNDLPEWHDQLGSFDKNHILKHMDSQLEPYIEMMDVAVCTLAEVLARHRWESIDLLHIDAEGHDWEILSETNLFALSPKIVIIEHSHLTAENRCRARQKLVDAGYNVLQIGGDFCAIRSRFRGLSGFRPKLGSASISSVLPDAGK